jgi:hypothetical protein
VRARLPCGSALRCHAFGCACVGPAPYDADVAAVQSIHVNDAPFPGVDHEQRDCAGRERTGGLGSERAACSERRPTATSAPGLGPPLPHLHRDWGSPLPHLHRDGSAACTAEGTGRFVCTTQAWVCVGCTEPSPGADVVGASPSPGADAARGGVPPRAATSTAPRAAAEIDAREQPSAGSATATRADTTGSSSRGERPKIAGAMERVLPVLHAAAARLAGKMSSWRKYLEQPR